MKRKTLKQQVKELCLKIKRLMAPPIKIEGTGFKYHPKIGYTWTHDHSQCD